MSRIVYICLRRPDAAARVTRHLDRLERPLTPDNIKVAAARIFGSDGIVIGLFGATDAIHTSERALCAGFLVHPENWSLPFSGRPDGAYALFRGNDHHIEVLSDTLASRTIWYFKNDDVFIASTSQRAIVALVGSFSFNTEVITWMLSSGTLGPQHAWDRRIRRLEGAASLVLDRRSWQICIKTEPVIFAPLDASDDEHATRLADALRQSIGSATFDYSRWVMPLSGGVDCRTLLCLLRDRTGLRTVTWGLRAAMRQRNNDARVARDLAEHFKLSHQYYELDLSSEPIGDIIKRYVACGEGCVDHLSGYMDGFAVWKALKDSGVQGIIRGDEAFGRNAISGGPLEVRSSLMPLWSDFSNLPAPAHFGIAAQETPEALLRRDGESLDTWRDRLQQQFRIPVVLAALNDLKLPYVEIVSPLSANSIIAEVRRLPDNLRTNKSLFMRIAHDLTPNVRFARHPATQPADDILKSPRAVRFLREELLVARDRSSLPRDLIDFALDRLVVAGAPQRLFRHWRNAKRALAAHLPARPKGAQPPPTRSIDFNRLAFRLILISQMQTLLTEDASEPLTRIL